MCGSLTRLLLYLLPLLRPFPFHFSSSLLHGISPHHRRRPKLHKINKHILFDSFDVHILARICTNMHSSRHSIGCTSFLFGSFSFIFIFVFDLVFVRLSSSLVLLVFTSASPLSHQCLRCALNASFILTQSLCYLYPLPFCYCFCFCVYFFLIWVCSFGLFCCEMQCLPLARKSFCPGRLSVCLSISLLVSLNPETDQRSVQPWSCTLCQCQVRDHFVRFNHRKIYNSLDSHTPHPPLPHLLTRQSKSDKGQPTKDKSVGMKERNAREPFQLLLFVAKLTAPYTV